MTHTPDDALRLLREGNERFVVGRPLQRDNLAAANAAAAQQTPHALVLACIDSRSAPEIVFDQGLDDIMTARVAGAYASDEVIGAIEFAASVVNVKAVVVMGHTNCGAVMGACDGVELGHLTGVLKHIAPALEGVETDGERTSANRAFVNDVARANARRAAARIVERSEIVSDRVEQEELRVVPAIHDLVTGVVTFL